MASDESGPTTQILELCTEEQFQEFLNNNVKVIIKFSATWCGPCRRIAEYYQDASNVFKSVKFGKVDVTNNEEMGFTHGIEYYPSFICYKDGKEVGKVFGAKFEQLKDAIDNLAKM